MKFSRRLHHAFTFPGLDAPMKLRQAHQPELEPSSPQWVARDLRGQVTATPSLPCPSGPEGASTAAQEITNFPPPVAGNADLEFLEWRLELL